MKTNKLLKISLLLFGIVVILSFGISSVAADNTTNSSIIFVSTQGNNSWDGQSAVWNGTSGPKLTITNATSTVTAGGTVYIAKGTYNESNINIHTNMTLTGESQTDTIINAQKKNSIFIIAKGLNITIQNLTLENGNTSTDGGAINNKGNLMVKTCTFKNNTAANGGAINNNGNLTVIDSKFENNNANNVSGGAINNNGILIVIGTVFNKNVAYGDKTTNGGFGGAINVEDGKLTIKNSVFKNNTANGTGGAINGGETMVITNSTFQNNTALYGGALFVDGTLTVSNSTFSNNSAPLGGGAILITGTSTVTNSTFNNNTANKGYGGAITNAPGGLNLVRYGKTSIEDITGTMTVTNSTFLNNTAKYGGAIENAGATTSHVNFNRIVGNTASEGSAIYNDNIYEGSVDASLNWWGSNSNPVSYVYGSVNVKSWLVLTTSTNATSILNGSNSTITANILYDNLGKYHNPINGCVPNMPVTFTGSYGTLNPTEISLTNGQAQSIFTSNSTGKAIITAKVDNQAVSIHIPSACLYLNPTLSEKNPIVGELFTITYKLSNSGPNIATNVTIFFQIPKGLEFINAKVDNGNWTYNPNNRTVTWTLNSVPVGDPYLYLTVKATDNGTYRIIPNTTSDTYNLNSGDSGVIIINVQTNNNNSGNGNGANTVNAASKTTIGLQETGLPLNYLILAVLMVLSGLIPKRK